VSAVRRLAWWQLRGLGWRAVLLIACVAIGVTARVSVGAFAAQFDTAVKGEARALLLADVEITGRSALPSERQQHLQAVLPPGSAVQSLTSCVTMAAHPSVWRSQIIQLMAVDPGFPFYGTLRLGGTKLEALFTDEPCTVVQRDLLVHLELAVGDMIRFGEAEFRIVGTIDELPGLAFGGFALGSRAIIAQQHLQRTGLLGFGARARYRTLVRVPELAQGPALVDTLIADWDLGQDSRKRMRGGEMSDDAVRVRSYRDAEDQVQTAFARLADFLRLVALSGLLLAGVGIAGVVRGIVAEELDAVALLQVLGASGRRVLGILLLQMALCGLAGGALGAVLGVAVQQGLTGAVQEFLPVQLPFVVDAGAMAWGLVLGLVTCVVFALEPLMAVIDVRPLQVLRGDAGRQRRWPRVVASMVAVAVVCALGMWEARSVVVGGVFVLGLVVLGVVLAGVAGVILPACAALRRVVPGFALRHGLTNLHRPGLRAGSAVVALGLATALLAGLAVYRSSLLAELEPGADERMPALFAINVLDADRVDFEAFFAERPAAEAELAPMVQARLAAINGEPIVADDASEAVSAAEERRRHFRRREQNLSWRDQPGAAETIVAGRWMDVTAERALDEIGEASVEAEFAESIGVGLGDELQLTIRGLPITVRVTSLREVRWASFQPNFFILVTPSLLRPASPKWIAAISVDTAEGRSALQGALVRQFPEISVFDVADVVAKVRALLDRIAWAVSFLALFALAAGLLVLTGLVAAGARQRRQEAALLRTLGARDSTLLVSLGVEFAVIGALGSVSGTALAMVVSALGMHYALDLDPSLPWALCAALVATVTALAVVVGLLACRRAVRAAPLEVLRDD
jgi:putative ABC transport system permease protein